MMRKLYSLVLLFLISITAIANDGVKIKSTIKEVTVYLSGARLKREALVTLKPGKNELILNNLSTNIDESSIQISGLENANVLAINYAINYLEKKDASEEIKGLHLKKDKLLQEKDFLQNQITGFDQELAVLKYNQRVNSDQTDLSLEKIQQISKYYRERTTTILNKKYTLNEALKASIIEINKLTNEITKVEGNSKEERGEIELKLDAPTGSTLNLIVTYNVTNTGWFPEYDLKSNNTTSNLEITYKAKVYQQTGTDWKDINVILSTGDPSLNNNKPTLDSKRLNFVYEDTRRQFLYKKLTESASEQTVADLDINSSNGAPGSKPKIRIRGANSLSYEREEDYNQNVETKEEGITNTRFKIKKTYTINSNTETTSIEIDKFKLPTTYAHYVAPELNENVFLTAELSDWEKYNLLTGEANIYFEGSYAGKALIEPDGITEKLVLSLGVDPNIIVERKEPKNFKSKSFIGATRIVEKSFEINIKNNKSVPINLVVEDRVPITDNKEIKIDDIVTGDSKYDDKKGILKWELSLPSKQSIKKSFSYTVKFPKGKRINL